MLFGIGACVSLAIALYDAAMIQTALAPAMNLLSDDLRRRLWWDWLEVVIPTVVLPALVALSARVVASSGDTDRRNGGWALLLGSCVWALGVGVIGLSWVSAGDGGWFNYAPDAATAFSPGGALARQTIGTIGAWLGLSIAAAAITWARRSSFRRSDGPGWRTRALLWTQPAVVVVGLFMAARLVGLLIDNPGMWGRS